MGMTWDDGLQIPIGDRELETCAGIKLPDVRAIKLLPGGIVFQIGWRKKTTAVGDLFVTYQQVDAALA
jgi:hypothetical protein